MEAQEGRAGFTQRREGREKGRKEDNFKFEI
jgi:hypothetical protein